MKRISLSRTAGLAIFLGFALSTTTFSGEQLYHHEQAPGSPPPPEKKGGDGKVMKEYLLELGGKEITIPMIPITGGTFRLGSGSGEEGRKTDEGPQVEVIVEPFWMGRYEIPWDAYNVFRSEYVTHSNHRVKPGKTAKAEWADAVSLPTPLWEQDSTPILEGLGTKEGFPAAGITQFAARQFTKWLSMKTGHFYRLPTEAEWEFAARAGTTTAYFFGDDPGSLGDYAWTFDNSEYDDLDKGYPGEGAGYRKIGLKKANPWGLHDIYGNVSEWVIDQYDAKGYARLAKGKKGWKDAILWPKEIYPCVVRGGNWRSDPEECRSASRLASHRKWQQRDPQIPRSLWWLTDGFAIGFRIVRPAIEPSEEDKRRFWGGGIEVIEDVLTGDAKQVRVKIGMDGGGGSR